MRSMKPPNAEAVKYKKLTSTTRSSSTEDIELLIYKGTLRPKLIDMCNTTSLSCNHMKTYQFEFWYTHKRKCIYISLKNK